MEILLIWIPLNILAVFVKMGLYFYLHTCVCLIHCHIPIKLLELSIFLFSLKIEFLLSIIL